MPGQDRNGPMGRGSRTGRGMGICNIDNASSDNQSGSKYGQGRRSRNKCFGSRGQGTDFVNRFRSFLGLGRQSAPEKQDLQNYVNDLETELKEAKDALKNISDSKDSQDDK